MELSGSSYNIVHRYSIFGATFDHLRPTRIKSSLVYRLQQWQLLSDSITLGNLRRGCYISFLPKYFSWELGSAREREREERERVRAHRSSSGVLEFLHHVTACSGNYETCSSPVSRENSYQRLSICRMPSYEPNMGLNAAPPSYLSPTPTCSSVSCSPLAFSLSLMTCKHDIDVSM